MKKIAPFLFILALLLTACGQTAATAEATSLPSPMPSPLPTATATPAGIVLTYEDNAQVELVTPAGRHIYLDVVNTGVFSAKPTAEDILLTTHLHGDHYYRDFADAFPGQKLTAAVGKIEFPDVSVTGIAAGHNSNDPILETGGSNYIYLIETGGLRIAHFGDIGQDALTAGQLAALGQIDVAIMQFDNSFSGMNAQNLKGFNLMDQVKPRLIIPTSHVSMPTIKIAVEKWAGYFAEGSAVKLTPGGLPAGTSLLVVGNMAAVYNNLYHLKPWK